MKTITPLMLLSLVLAVVPIPFVQAQSPQESLDEYVSDLQKSPNDYALRERIIRHVRTMRPAPALPNETVRLEGRAEAAARSARKPEDYLDAAAEYKKALLIAPWVPSYYFNLGIVLERANGPQEAMSAFKFYLLTEPEEKEAIQVRKAIAGLEYQIEKAAVEAQKPKYPTPQDLTGYWRTNSHPEPNQVTADGDWLLFKCFANGCAVSGAIIKFRLSQAELEGTKSEGGLRGSKTLSKNETSTVACLDHLNRQGGFSSRQIHVKGTVSNDWKTLTFRYQDRVKMPGCTLGHEEIEVVYNR